MNTKEFLRNADTLKRRATRIIEESGVLPIFQSLGKVHFVGSYYLDLMIRPDIDVVILAPKFDRGAVLGATVRLMKLNYFQTVGTYDGVRFKIPYSHKKGYYWELIRRTPQGVWKFDVWLKTPKDDDSIKPALKYKKLLTPEKRRLILQIKNKHYDGDLLYTKGVYGAKIYKAVLERGIKSIRAFKPE